MRTRTHRLAIVMALLLPSLLWAGEESQAEFIRRSAQTARPDTALESTREIKIFALRYQEADGLARIISVLVPGHEATIAVDGKTNTLIVAASPDRMTQMESVIAELDVPSVDTSDVPQMLYRIYMLELPVEHQNLRSFSMELEGTGELAAAELLNALEDTDLQIDAVSQEPEDARWQKWQLFIDGRAASTESVKRIIARIPDSRLWRLQWDDEALPRPAVRVAPLPDELDKHLHQLLGADIGIVGYWFGNLSVPGTIRAPIGPWLFDMEVKRSTQADQVELEITVESEWQSGQNAWKILGNSVRCHITKPVIIGYNRKSHGTRTMGALVIVPQEDPLPRKSR